MPSRDSELYKDKIEVSLDGRQIFYLFFGGAVIVGMVFVLGVLVGRRVEARGHIDRAQTRAEADPLAALDRLEGSGGLSFHGALTGKQSASDVEKTIDDLAKARAAAPADKKAAKPPMPPPAAAPAPVENNAIKHAADDKAPENDRTDAKKADAKPDAKKADAKPDARKADAKAEAKKTEATLDAKPDAKKPEVKSDGKLDAKADPKRTDKKEEKTEAKADPAKPDSPKPRFTLQLSSFQDKAEADAFLSSVKAAGFQPYLMQAEVEGKGTFYRVRMGNYRSLEAANDAKSEFEKTSKKSASVMRL